MDMIVVTMEQSSALQTTVIDPNDLLIFARVAELGSFSRAADKVGLPKSSVSRRLAALEQRLGERLLLRTTRRQTLTEFGQQLLEHAKQVVLEVEAVAALSERRQATPTGRLRVSMPADIANLLLADMLGAFVAMYPDISLELDLSARRVDLLGEGFDVAVRIGALPDDSLLAARRLSLMSTGVYASPQYLAEHGTPQVPQDLLQHQAVRLLGGTGEPMPWRLVNGEQEWTALPPGRFAANAPDLLLRMVLAGTGIGAVPDVFAQADVRRNALVRILPDWCFPRMPISAVFPGRKLMPPKTRVFIEMLHAALGDPHAV